MVKSPPIKVLHVVGGMGMGGVENWLMQVLRQLTQAHARCNIQIDFLVETDEPRLFDAEILAKGSKIIRCLNPKNPIIYARNFFQAYRTHGPYDVVHSHIHHYSGYVLALAHQAGVPVRIAHSHSNNQSSQNRLLRRCYLRFSEFLIHRYATQGLACSPFAAHALFGEQWQHDARWQVLNCGLDFSAWPPASGQIENKAISNDITEPITIGHVGRFVEAKNHRFLIEVIDALRQYEKSPDIHLLLLGDGPLRADIEAEVQHRGLRNIVTFMGTCSNVPEMLAKRVHCFIFPSTNEGLGLAAVEAQAAGIPCLVSDNIPQDADIIPELVCRLPLSTSPEHWSRVLLQHYQHHRTYSYSKALSQAKASSFNLDNTIRQLQEIYTGGTTNTSLSEQRSLVSTYSQAK